MTTEIISYSNLVTIIDFHSGTTTCHAILNPPHQAPGLIMYGGNTTRSRPCPHLQPKRPRVSPVLEYDNVSLNDTDGEAKNHFGPTRVTVDHIKVWE